jgi:hypothetical protein
MIAATTRSLILRGLNRETAPMRPASSGHCTKKLLEIRTTRSSVPARKSLALYRKAARNRPILLPRCSDTLSLDNDPTSHQCNRCHVRTRSSACDTFSRCWARRVRCWLAFSLASVLRSVASAAGRPVLFGDFAATTTESDFSRPCIIGFGSSPSRCGPVGLRPVAGRETSQVPARSVPT